MDTLELLKSVEIEQELGSDNDVDKGKYSSDLSDYESNGNENEIALNPVDIPEKPEVPVVENEIRDIIIENVCIAIEQHDL